MILTRESILNLGLESGDIFAVKGGWFSGWACRNLIAPKTDRFHFGLIWMTTNDGDRVILESLGEGSPLETVVDLLLHPLPKAGPIGQAVAIGRLSKYIGKDLRFFRPRFISRKDRRAAPVCLTCYGSRSYGYDYLAKLLIASLCKWTRILIRERRLRRLTVLEIPSIGDKRSLICTRAADKAYELIGQDILPNGVTATPNAYEEAFLEGVLEEITPDEILINI
jgi:hypothetical protein